MGVRATSKKPNLQKKRATGIKPNSNHKPQPSQTGVLLYARCARWFIEVEFIIKEVCQRRKERIHCHLQQKPEFTISNFDQSVKKSLALVIRYSLQFC